VVLPDGFKVALIDHGQAMNAAVKTHGVMIPLSAPDEYKRSACADGHTETSESAKMAG
jgi:hypothetical protein